jgi:hypothetical protein
MPRGVAPLDPLSPIGKLRVLVGDTQTSPLEEPEFGFADYAVFDDDALEAALSAADGNQYRAAGNLLAVMAAEYMQLGKSVRTDDLSIDTRSRGKDLFEVARSFWDQAVAVDATAGDSFLAIVPFAGRAPQHPYIRPEATPHYSRRVL